MRSSSEVFAHYKKNKIMAILRTSESDNVVPAIEALIAGGIDVVEVSLVTPDAISIIKSIHNSLGSKVLMGAGTVLDGESARAAILAGVDFLVTPVVAPEVIKCARRYGKVCFSGAYTPTEAVSAFALGSDAIKIFPAVPAGPEYIKALHGPLPQIPLVAVGGVAFDNIEAFMTAGAIGVAAGSSLVKKEMIVKEQYQKIKEEAEKWVSEIERIQNL